MSVANNISVDYDKEYIQTNEKGKVNTIYIPDLQYTAIGKFIIFRLKEDRDVKILITGKGKTTGTGKTTLAIILARFVNWVRNELFNTNHNWCAEEYSFMNVWDYLRSYKEAKPGDPLITDELEYMADRRSHQTNQNKKFSQAWSVLRWKNVVTIGTAPGLMDIEKRIPEGADIWLNVVQKGKANVYYLTMHDFTMERIIRRFRNGQFKESVLWAELVDDEDYDWLKNKKKSIGVPGIDDYKDKQLDESDLNDAVREVRNDTVRDITMKLKELGMLDRFTQTSIGEMVGVSQSKVSEIHIEMEKEGLI